MMITLLADIGGRAGGNVTNPGPAVGGGGGGWGIMNIFLGVCIPGIGGGGAGENGTNIGPAAGGGGWIGEMMCKAPGAGVGVRGGMAWNPRNPKKWANVASGSP